MQNEVLSWALHCSRTTGNTRLVVTQMAIMADESGIITASAGDLMRKTNLSRNTIKRALRRLLEAGEVRCLINTAGDHEGRVSKEVAQQASDGRGVYQLSCFNRRGEFIGAEAMKEAA
jgi:DNA-binding MarR family transcriptional regulator